MILYSKDSKRTEINSRTMLIENFKETSTFTIYRNILYIVIPLLMLCGCATNKPYLAHPENNAISTELPQGEIEHRIYMIGDAGGLDNKKNKKNNVVYELHQSIKKDTAEKSVIFLGDNIYNYGLGQEGDKDRPSQESILQAQLDVAKGNDANLYIIPGNHDWNNNKPLGLEAIKRQGEYVKDKRIDNERVKFYPHDGCGDPKVVKVNKDLVYVFIDSQWWVHDWSSEPEINNGCKVKSRREFLDRMKDIIIDHKNDKIMLILHHPIVSNGNHGGNFSFKNHVFPFTKSNEGLFIPLPFIGSVYPLFRQLGGNNQDNSHALLQDLYKSLEGVIRGYDVSQAIFVSGHDHLLQHSMEQFIFQKSPIHYIVSGSGAKTDLAIKGNNASYAQSARGYAVMHLYKNGSTWLDFYTISNNGAKKLEYRTQIYNQKPGKLDFMPKPRSASEDQDIIAAPNPDFSKGPIYKFLMGDQYRPSWTTPIKTPTFHLNKYYGGLTPIKKGGGLFSRTLRLENSDGKQFALRSINKDFFKAVPENLQHLEIMKLYSDQNTAAIPYGALYISELSKAAEVYHTNPKVVYLDDPSELGPFESFFPKGHYLMEERPAGDWSDTSLFGSSKKVMGYNDLLHILRKKTSHFVDQEWVLKSRLFDILIHDRDRHDDQWRWAAFDEGDKTMYRPIPRDRDWAFFKYGGVIPWIMGNVVDKKLKSFNANKIDVTALATNANNFDRYFLNELNWDDWNRVIDRFVKNLTDEAIEQSIDVLPEESRSYLYDEIVPKLKSRRDILKRDVKKYYDFISEEVEITGTDEKDIFEINQMVNGDLQVIVYRDSKKHGKTEKYNRIILQAETNEVRIYGLADKDEFDININGASKTKIRIIGGIGHDKVTVLNAGNHKARVSIYDDPNGIDISDPSLVKTHLDNDLRTNEYNRRGFLYDTGLPWLTFGYAPDNGLTFGFGTNIIKHGWRKSPYKSSHLFNIEITPGDRFSYDIEYEGDFPGLLGKSLDFSPSFFVEVPDNVNYFGIGDNEMHDTENSDFNWIQLSTYGIHPSIVHRAAGGGIKLSLSPTYESYKVDDEDEDPNITNVLPEFIPESFERSHFLGLRSDVRLSTLNSLIKPTRGIQIDGQINYQNELGEDNTTLKLGGSFAWFTSLSLDLDITLASNTGYQYIFGDPRFYQYPAMGNKAYLRPFRNERFRGKSILYQQFDLRFKLFNWNNSIIPLTVGGISGYDFGQSYFNGQDTGDLKHGWTGGLWFDLVGAFIFRAAYSKSDEGGYLKFEAGFAF